MGWCAMFDDERRGGGGKAGILVDAFREEANCHPPRQRAIKSGSSALTSLAQVAGFV